METLCCVSTTLDYKTIESRVKNEGLSFLTITLANFGADLQKGLDQGFVDHALFTGFQFRGGLPQFLGGFLDRVFDRSNGRLLEVPDVDAIFAIRQITLMWAKIEIPCTPARVSRAIAGYIECESDVRRFDALRSQDMYSDFKRISDLLFRDLFVSIDRKVAYYELVPKHGPGATADKLMGNQKYNQVEWTDRLEEVFPHRIYLFPNWGLSRQLPESDIREPGNERPVRVITVPKTQKTPRIIAIEPTCMQYMQQAVLEVIYDGVDEDFVLSSLIGFLDQTPNQELARKGSIDGKLATLDLKEASDRVSNQLVLNMLSSYPHLNDAVQATRSRKADVPGHGVKRLAKFASMGSALCFPFEAMTFLTLIFLGIERELSRPLTKKDVRSFLGKVRVFGDDIIVPKEYTRSVVRELEAFGFLVNSSKSFWNGLFRESCGKEYYAGQDVSITRVRTGLPTQRKDAREVLATSSLRNQLYRAGLWRTVAFLDEWLGTKIPYPVVEETSPAIGRHSFLGIDQDMAQHRRSSETGYPSAGPVLVRIQKRWDRNLHRPVVKAYEVDTTLPRNEVDGVGALLKFFLKRGDLPIADRRHLERSGRPRSVDIKARWLPLW
jgi:hypothetical protein